MESFQTNQFTLVTELSQSDKHPPVVASSPSKASSGRRRSLQEIFNLPEISSSHSTIPSKALQINQAPAMASATIVPSTPVIAHAIPSTPVVASVTPRSAKSSKPDGGIYSIDPFFFLMFNKTDIVMKKLKWLYRPDAEAVWLLSLACQHPLRSRRTN